MLTEDEVLELELAGVEAVPDLVQHRALEPAEEVGQVELLLHFGRGHGSALQLLQELFGGDLRVAGSTGPEGQEHRQQ